MRFQCDCSIQWYSFQHTFGTGFKLLYWQTLIQTILYFFFGRGHFGMNTFYCETSKKVVSPDLTNDPTPSAGGPNHGPYFHSTRCCCSTGSSTKGEEVGWVAVVESTRLGWELFNEENPMGEFWRYWSTRNIYPWDLQILWVYSIWGWDESVWYVFVFLVFTMLISLSFHFSAVDLVFLSCFPLQLSPNSCSLHSTSMHVCPPKMDMSDVYIITITYNI